MAVCLIEVWERFGFYGMQALIIYYMVQRLGFEDSKANLVWGAAAALIYVSPIVGGWIGDQILGTKRTMVLGAVIMSLGYALMTIPTVNTWFLYVSLGVVVVGNGLFKPNAGNLVRKIFKGDDERLDSAFTIYYMAVNIGSTVSILLTPIIKSKLTAVYGVDIGWHGAFSVSCVGLIIGLAHYFAMKQTLVYYGSDADDKPLNIKKLVFVIIGSVLAVLASALILEYQALARAFVYIAVLITTIIFVYLIAKSEIKERSGLIVVFILTIQTVFFFVFYQQMSTSLALFALRNVDWNFNVFGFHMWTWQPAQFFALNPLWIMILSPFLAWLYNWTNKNNINFSVATKFFLGFVVVALGFFIFSFSGEFAVDGKTSSWVMIWGYGAYSLGELLVSGLGLAMIARFVPERMGGFMMGAYFVASGSSQYLGGVVANFASIPKNVTDPLQTLPIYTDLFNKLGYAAIGCTLISLAVLPKLLSLTKHHESYVALQK
ncbi:MFS transporter [Parashewanella spongiae]|uniref:MFS transporter n=2 Tax=Parashewanella spongiae TaxID=342950 RepID=A0A3A6SXE3_9GAMM|nr:MFS transporter [Parashewanella spongiae]